MEKLAWGEFYQCLKPELLYPGFLQGWNCCRSKVRALPSWLDKVLWELEEVIQIAARYCDRTHGHGDFDGFILLQKEDLRVILLNICTDKWQLHSITFQWEHYSHNIGNGKTFSCAFQPGDDVWKEPIGGVRHRHGESVKTGSTPEQGDTETRRIIRTGERYCPSHPSHKGVEGRINPQSSCPRAWEEDSK